MKNWRMMVVLLLCLVLAGNISCRPANTENAETPQKSVEQGNSTVTVSGSGNIEVANELKLSFGVAGKIDKLYFDEGDNVSKGTVLAKLDTDTLELALSQAQVAKDKAELALDEAKAAQTKAEVAVTQAEVARQVAAHELENARDIYADVDTQAARAAVTEARNYLDYAQGMLDQASLARDIIKWTNEVSTAEERLRAAELNLDNILAIPDTTEEVAIKRHQLELAEQSLELSKQSLEVAQKSPALAEQSLKLAEQSLKLAQKQLNDATIIAPFDGLIAKVPVDEGDTVSAVTPIIHLIDPTSMELNVEVDEIDIPGVKVGQRAIIQVDALPDLSFEGKVVSISLLPTIETGLVMYDAKIKFDIPEDVGLRAGMSATADIVITE